MRKNCRLIFSLIICVLAVSLTTEAAQYRLDPIFQPDVGGGQVLAMKSREDGTTLLVTTSGVQRLFASGQKDKTWKLSTAFGPVRATKAKIATYKSFIYVSGDFTEFLGVPRSGFIRLKDDGTVDAAYPNVLDAGAVVEDFLVLADGKVVLTGNFFAAYEKSNESILIQYLLRLNSNGEIDQPWAENLPLIGDSNGSLIYGFYWPGLSLAREVAHDYLYVGADKPNDGVVAPPLRRITSSGVFDTSFATLETDQDAEIVALRWTNAKTLMAVVRTTASGDSIKTVDGATGAIVKPGLNSHSAEGNTDVIDRIDAIYPVGEGLKTTYLLTGSFHTLDADDGNPHPNPRFMLVVDSALSSLPSAKIFGGGVYGTSIADYQFGKLTAVGVREGAVTFAGQLNSYSGAQCTSVLRTNKLPNSGIYLGETLVETLQNDFSGSQLNITLNILNGTSNPLPSLRFRAYEGEEVLYDRQITDQPTIGIPEFTLKFEQTFPATEGKVFSLPIDPFETYLKTANRDTEGEGHFYELIGVLEQAIGDRWLPVDTLVIARGSDFGEGPFTGRPGSMDRSPSKAKDNLNPAGISITISSQNSTLAPGKSTKITATSRVKGKSSLKIPAELMKFSASKGSVDKNGVYVAKNVPPNTEVTIEGLFKFNGTSYRDSLKITVK